MRTSRVLVGSTDQAGMDPEGLDAYSSDGQLVGRVVGFLEEIPMNEAELAEVPVDLLSSSIESAKSRRVLIDGHGYISQANIILPIDQLEIDWRGRRVVLPLTMAQIEHMPHKSRV